MVINKILSKLNQISSNWKYRTSVKLGTLVVSKVRDPRLRADQFQAMIYRTIFFDKKLGPSGPRIPVESKMTARNEDFEEFKLKLNSTMTTLQNSVSELESQLGNIKDETTTDVEEIVDGFDILIDSLNTVSFDLGTV